LVRAHNYTFSTEGVHGRVMPPTGHPLPEALIPGHAAGNSSRHYLSQSPTDPTSPPDAQFPWLGMSGGPTNGGGYEGDNSHSADGRIGRRQEPGRDNSRDWPTAPPDQSASRDRSRPNGGGTSAKSPSGTSRICKKCGESLTGQFVRALGGTFHLECFKCNVCC
jgi:hypothetical protein